MVITNNIYDRDINNLSDNWFYFENGLKSIAKTDIHLYQLVRKRYLQNIEIIENTKNTIIDYLHRIYPEIPSQKFIKFLEEIEFFNPLLFVENSWFESIEFGLLYCMLRLRKPEVLVETGSNIGHSAFFELMAIKLNGAGKLYCFDILNIGDVATESVEHITQGFCWAERPIKFNRKYDPMLLEFIPASLITKNNFKLISGDTKQTLPKFLNENDESITFFFHDSDHSEDHMWFEYDTIKSRIDSYYGIFASHDIMNKTCWPKFLHENRDYSIIYQGNTGIAERLPVVS